MLDLKTGRNFHKSSLAWFLPGVSCTRDISLDSILPSCILLAMRRHARGILWKTTLQNWSRERSSERADRMNNKYGYRLVDILRGADGSREPGGCRGERWEGEEVKCSNEGKREIKAVVSSRGWLARTLLLHFYTALLAFGCLDDQWTDCNDDNYLNDFKWIGNMCTKYNYPTP